MVSRVLGLVREQVFAIFFGAGIYTDAFFAAFRIPNLLRELFAEGVFSAAFIPTFNEEKTKRGLGPAFQLANLVFTAMTLLTALVCLTGIILTPIIVKYMTPGFVDVEGQMQLTILLARIMWPLLLFMSLASVATGVLNSFGMFGIPALAPSMFNLAMIFSGIFLRQYFNPPILAMAIGVFIGGSGQLSFQVPALFRLGFKFKPFLDLADKRLKKIFMLMLPASVGTAAIQINIFVATLLASLLPAGSLSYLNYGYRLMHLPLALFGVAVASVSLPNFSTLYAKDDLDGLKREYLDSLRFSLFLIVPAIFFILSATYPIVGTIFQHGRFEFADTVATVNVLRIYAIGLLAFATVKVTAQVFFAMQDTKTPMKVGVITVAANIILNIILMKPFQYLGLAMGTVIAGFVNMTVLLSILRPRFGGIGIPRLTVFIFKIIGLNMVLAAVMILLAGETGINKPEAGAVLRGIMLLVMAIGYIIPYLYISKIMGIDEVKKITDLIRRGK
ncbi:MAG: murein biosynthesis integral membrane protein MurJ [candidate division Zixibacteria bacterium]|nr:murein biosynthesis integral membrane protein MurJ [candidate division Zixibacteria bacterium]